MKEATRPAASLGNTSPADQKIPNLGQFDGEPKVYTYKVIKSYKHDPKAFTQVQGGSATSCRMVEKSAPAKVFQNFDTEKDNKTVLSN